MPSDQIKEYVLKSFNEDKNIIEATNEFMQRIFNDFKFVSGFSDITTPIETIFKKRKVFVKILHNLQSQLLEVLVFLQDM